MSTLSDHIERLTRLAKSINSTAITTLTAPNNGPFAIAVLQTPLENLIRDIDASELGLFTLQTRSGEPKEEISRVAFSGATPLRKNVKRRDDGKRKEVEIEPEVYAQAALKYLDRFEYIRPMPRARTQVLETLEQLSSVREHIQASSETLEQTANANRPPLSPKSKVNEEEKRIQDLQKRLDEVKKRKSAVLHQEKSTKIPRSRPSASRKPLPSKPLIKTSPSASCKPPPNPTPKPSTPCRDPQDEKFWTTPAKAGRALRVSAGGRDIHLDESSLLLDEKSDLLADMSLGEMSPVPTTRTKLGVGSYDSDADVETGVARKQAGFDDGDMKDEQDGEDEDTIVLPKTTLLPSPPSSPTPPPPPSLSTQRSTPSEEQILRSPPSAKRTPNAGSKNKVKITTHTEIIIAKVWSSVGEIIMPGNPFKDGQRPPRAKETIAHLQSLSTLSPNLPSPSISSISSTTPNQPTQQGILTAHLILALLSSPSTCRLSLKAVKDVLAEKGAGASGSRIVYGSVAKRLVRIERGGGEQIVTFDV